jgi:hypothetical protein
MPDRGKPRHLTANRGNSCIAALYRLQAPLPRPMVRVDRFSIRSSCMKRTTLPSAARVLSVVLLASGTYAMADDHGPVQFRGLINDYTVATVPGGPYEMHGQWSMVLHPERGTADFFADMTMSSFGTTVAGTEDPTQAGVNPHTHHIRLTDIAVNSDATGCPTYKTPTTVRFQINGTLSLMTGNGSLLKGETDPPSSSLQVCVSGGPDVEYSNVTMVFSAPASGHFGTQAIHGVVSKASAHPNWNR